MLRVALGNVFIERYAEKFSEPGRNERGKISDFVATFRRSYDCSNVVVGKGNTDVVKKYVYEQSYEINYEK